MRHPLPAERRVDARYALLSACVVLGLPAAILAASALSDAAQGWAGTACYLAWFALLTLAWLGLTRAGEAYRREHVSRVAAEEGRLNQAVR